jgi:hypothetical protein
MPVDRGDSKQGLVITVVFLSILVLTLGVTTYLGFRGQKLLAAETQKAHEAEANAKKGKDWEEFKAKQLAAYIGVAPAEDLGALSKLRGDYETAGKFAEVDRPAFDNIVKKMEDRENGVGWDAANKKASNPLLNQIAALSKDLADQKALYARAEKENKASLDDLNRQLKESETRASSFRDQLSEAKSQAANAVNEKGKAFAQLQEQVAQLEEQKDQAQKGAAAMAQDKDKTIAVLQHDVKELQKGNQALLGRVAPIDVTRYDLAKGKVTTVRNGMAFINLGSADNVKSDLTFSVYAQSRDGRPEGDRKASLEVVNVLGPHQSMARITQVRDPGRDPIMDGDLLFNPVWSSSQRQHVAVAGLIDLNGDGRDSTLEFIQGLQAQGIVVDGYLDLRDLTIKGNGITMQTNYLVVGENPDVGSAEAQTARANSTTERKKQILELMGKMREQATQLGVQVVGARRFMTLIGYKVAAHPAPPDYDARPAGVGSVSENPDTGSDFREPASKRTDKDNAGDEGDKAKGKAKKPPKQDEDNPDKDKDKDK